MAKVVVDLSLFAVWSTACLAGSAANCDVSRTKRTPQPVRCLLYKPLSQFLSSMSFSSAQRVILRGQSLRLFLVRRRSEPSSISRSLHTQRSLHLTGMATQYDCILIGSGQAGTPLASAFAKAGKKTALVERTHVGGCCVNEGCTPTKTMVASGRAAYLARRGPDYGVHLYSESGYFGTLAKENSVKIDMEKVRDRKRKIVESFRAGNLRRLQDAQVDILMGEGSFVDAKTIKVKMNDGNEVLATADTICINTGERPAAPTIPGIEQVPVDLVLNSTSIMELARVPKHLLVVGGGYIGVEFGQLFRRPVFLLIPVFTS